MRTYKHSVNMHSAFYTHTYRGEVVRSGEAFSYAYIVWDLSANRTWEYEKFHEARSMTLPRRTHSNPTNEWTVRATKFGSKASEEVKPSAYFSHGDSSDLSAIGDGDGDDSFEFPQNNENHQQQEEQQDQDSDDDF